MKKLIIAFVVVVILVVGVFGSAVMAAPPSASPTGIWDAILDVVEDIQTTLNNTQTTVNNIQTTLNNIQTTLSNLGQGMGVLFQGMSFGLTSVSQLDGKVDAISANMTQMQTLEDGYTVSGNYTAYGNFEYDELRHVSLTLHWADMDVASDSLSVNAFLNDLGATMFIGSGPGSGHYWEVKEQGTVTVEFTTDKWSIIGINPHPTDSFNIRYSATVTWVPEP